MKRKFLLLTFLLALSQQSYSMDWWNNISTEEKIRVGVAIGATGYLVKNSVDIIQYTLMRDQPLLKSDKLFLTGNAIAISAHVAACLNVVSPSPRLSYLANNGTMLGLACSFSGVISMCKEEMQQKRL